MGSKRLRATAFTTPRVVGEPPPGYYRWDDVPVRYRRPRRVHKVPDGVPVKCETCEGVLSPGCRARRRVTLAGEAVYRHFHCP